jgi:hypothetical protein
MCFSCASARMLVCALVGHACMHTYVCMCVCVCVHVPACTLVCASSDVYMHSLLHTDVYLKVMYAYRYVWVRAPARVCAFFCACARMYALL